jgi:hypothetical protein
MRVLFYVEPITERDTPTWKTSWIYFVNMMATSIRRDNPSAEFWCIVGDGLEDTAGKILQNCQIAVLHHTELIPRFGKSALDATISWYSAPSPSALSDMAALIKSRLPDAAYQPDVCITFSSAPFLSFAFPGTAVLHFELGLVSRHPFPETAYLDPLGMFNNSYPKQHQDILRGYIAEASERRLVEGFRKKFLPLISANNPIADLIKPALAQYDASILLSLQFSQYYGYDAHATYPDQYDLLIQTLASVPPEIAVVVVEHPQFPIMKQETVQYLRSRYPNFIWLDEFRHLPSASQYLIEYVDLVITVSSSVGLQTLLWKKPLVVLGSSHLDVIADANTLEQVPHIIGRPWPDYKENVLAWHLSRYTIPFDLLQHQQALTDRINAARHCVATGDYADCFEKPFADIEAIARAYSIELNNETSCTAVDAVLTELSQALPDDIHTQRNDASKSMDQAVSAPVAPRHTIATKAPGLLKQILNSIKR